MGQRPGRGHADQLRGADRARAPHPPLAPQTCSWHPGTRGPSLRTSITGCTKCRFCSAGLDASETHKDPVKPQCFPGKAPYLYFKLIHCQGLALRKMIAADLRYFIGTSFFSVQKSKLAYNKTACYILTVLPMTTFL